MQGGRRALLATNIPEEGSSTARDSAEDSVISDIMYVRETVEVSNRVDGSIAAEVDSTDSHTDGTVEAAELCMNQDAAAENFPQLTAASISCCMWSYQRLPDVVVTTRLMSGTRVGLASICQFPGRPLLTWPGHYTVESALHSTDWIVEVERPSAAELSLGTVFTITNGTESTYVRMLVWQPTYIVLTNGTGVHAAACPGELCIGQGAVTIVNGEPVLADQVEVFVLQAAPSAVQ